MRIKMNTYEIKKQEMVIDNIYNIIEHNKNIINTQDVFKSLNNYEYEIFTNKCFDINSEYTNKIIENTGENNLTKILDKRSLCGMIWWIICTKIHESIIKSIIEYDGSLSVNKTGTDEVLFDMSKALCAADFTITNKDTGKQTKIEVQHCNYIINKSTSNSMYLELKYGKVKKNKYILNYVDKDGCLFFGFIDTTKMNKDNSKYCDRLPNQQKSGYVILERNVFSKFYDASLCQTHGFNKLCGKNCIL